MPPTGLLPPCPSGTKDCETDRHGSSAPLPEGARDDRRSSPALRNRTRPRLTAGFLLHQLPLTVDGAEDEQGQQDGGQGAADDGSQGRVPRAGGRGRDPHEVHLAGAWKPREWDQPPRRPRQRPALTAAVGVGRGLHAGKPSPQKPVGGGWR